MASQGGCACGSVRYRLTEEPLVVHVCHCLDCQTLSGSAFALNLWMAKKGVEVSGDTLNTFELKGGSGRAHHVSFCKQCGTKLFSDYSGAKNSLFVAAGTLDDASDVRPTMHIFTKDKQPWVNIDDGAPAFEAFYDIPSTWSAQQLERLQAVMSD